MLPSRLIPIAAALACCLAATLPTPAESPRLVGYAESGTLIYPNFVVEEVKEYQVVRAANARSNQAASSEDRESHPSFDRVSVDPTSSPTSQGTEPMDFTWALPTPYGVFGFQRSRLGNYIYRLVRIKQNGSIQIIPGFSSEIFGIVRHSDKNGKFLVFSSTSLYEIDTETGSITRQVPSLATEGSVIRRGVAHYGGDYLYLVIGQWHPEIPGPNEVLKIDRDSLEIIQKLEKGTYLLDINKTGEYIALSGTPQSAISQFRTSDLSMMGVIDDQSPLGIAVMTYLDADNLLVRLVQPSIRASQSTTDARVYWRPQMDRVSYPQIVIPGGSYNFSGTAATSPSRNLLVSRVWTSNDAYLMDTRSLRQEVFAANFFGSYAEFFRNRPWVCLLQTDGPLNFRISYEGTTQGTRATISAPFEPKRFSIFSYEAEAEFDVAVWREAEGELQLLWERNNVPGVGYGWIDLPIAPGELPMSPGAYWLTWSARGPGRPAGRIPGQPGDGIVFTRPDGPLAVPLAGAQITDDRWGMFLSDDTTPAGWLVR